MHEEKRRNSTSNYSTSGKKWTLPSPKHETSHPDLNRDLLSYLPAPIHSPQRKLSPLPHPHAAVEIWEWVNRDKKDVARKKISFASFLLISRWKPMDLPIKKELGSLLIAVLLVGCATSSGILPKKQQKAIPSEANLVIISSSASPDSITEAYETQLEENGFSFADREDRSLETHPKSVGEQTYLKVKAEARSTSEGSELLLRGMWGRPATAAGALVAKDEGSVTADKRAFWVKKGAPGRAFAFLVLTANDLPGEIEYKEEDT